MNLFRHNGIEDFECIKRRLADLPSQKMGTQQSVCETGELYIEFYEDGLARPDDVKIIERSVAQRMWRSLASHLDARKGTVYWRVPFEYEIIPTHVIVRYDDEGHDVDELLDRKCVKDKNWVSLKCYCRLYRSTMPVPVYETRTGERAAA